MTAPEPDPIAAAFDEYAPPPSDVVPKREPAADLPPIPTGLGVAYYGYMTDGDGVSREEGHATISAPYQPKDNR